MEEYVTKTRGPCIILAGAGTGKTHSIIEKLKYLISKKVYPIERIVCLTFSNEATKSLRERMLPYIVGDKEPVIKTFHSFCADLLRKHGEKIGVKHNFKIILPDDGKLLLHKYFKINPNLCNDYIDDISISKDLGNTLDNVGSRKTLDEIEELAKELEEIKFRINTSHIKKMAKSDFDSLKEKRDKMESELKAARFAIAWRNYEKIKANKGGLDYSDLHHKAYELLSKHPEVAHDFDYVIVDEFQDTNKMQCMILDKLASHRNITVVGDLNQSIYRFRGAYDENFSYFKKIMDVKEKDIYTLTKSYRSANKILEIAHTLIKNNYAVPEDCFEVKNAYDRIGENTKVFELKNDKEEVRKIVEIIRSELKYTRAKEICVIFRTHKDALLLKRQLDYENIPYTSINRDSLLKVPIVKIVRAYLTLLDKLANKSKGGDGSLWDIMDYTLQNNADKLAFTKELYSWKEDDCIALKFMNGLSPLSEQGSIQIMSVKKILNSLLEVHKSPVKDILKKVYELLGAKDKESLLVLEKFYAFVSEFTEGDGEDLQSLLHHLSAIEALKISVECPALVKDGVRIMTNHSTKGLEYDVVIMSGMAQKKFPSERINKYEAAEDAAESIRKQIMEERRLCYVGFTRARSRLYLTYAKEYGQRSFEPSQFLKEINYTDNRIVDFVKDESTLYNPPKLEIIPIEAVKVESVTFSPSALQAFDECQKRYEMKYIYNMPDSVPQSWEAMTMGNFIHRVLEEGVRKMCKTFKDLEDCAKIVQMEEYVDVNLEEVMPYLKIFFERNKDRYNEKSRTEQYLRTVIDGITFNGYADRIDINENGELSIIDYKTGKSDVKPRYRNWQLGIYALAAKNLGKPKSLILEMLQKEHPIEFVLDEKGIAKEIHSARTQFDLDVVKKEIVDTAKRILEARQSGFKPCNPEKNCEFCEDMVYNKK